MVSCLMTVAATFLRPGALAECVTRSGTLVSCLMTGSYRGVACDKPSRAHAAQRVPARRSGIAENLNWLPATFIKECLDGLQILAGLLLPPKAT